MTRKRRRYDVIRHGTSWTVATLGAKYGLARRTLDAAILSRKTVISTLCELMVGPAAHSGVQCNYGVERVGLRSLLTSLVDLHDKYMQMQGPSAQTVAS